MTPERAKEIAARHLKEWEDSHGYHSPHLVDCGADAILAAVAEALAAPVPVPMSEVELSQLERRWEETALRHDAWDTWSHQRLAAEVRTLWRLLLDCDGQEAFQAGHVAGYDAGQRSLGHTEELT